MRSYGCDRGFPYQVGGHGGLPGSLVSDLCLLGWLFPIPCSLSLFPPHKIVLLFLEINPRDEVAFPPEKQRGSAELEIAYKLS
jgi:hypothetical protein